VPATYIHSLLGSRNWTEGVKQTGRARTVNREKLQVEEVIKELKNPGSFRSQVFYPYIEMIKIRKKLPAFHPNAEFEIMNLDPRVFAIRRSSDDQTVYAVTNISSTDVKFAIPGLDGTTTLSDLHSNQTFASDSIELKPYQYVWLNNPHEN
jgi:sucrose phosphorylase